ncbi:MAG: hypothetical protein A3G07_01765 [Candidatus Doudnabacteria bacterium RIFCSPLOWO2_12_FULL_47_12]|nr:MAG: hypothetical protein A3G07_01765 [Candidatus Doudnabacteria bacterium RIFCSPLOWO2_12_FULL_47_12]
MFEKVFPILKRKINGQRLVYLDNASTAQKPESVLRAMDDFYRKHNANTHRGIHTLSQEATELYEGARDKVQKFINAGFREEIILTSGATEAINLVVWTWGHENIHAGDEILLSEMEHHSNIVPWQILAKKKRAKIKYAPIDGNGRLKLPSLIPLISPRTRIVSIAHISNVLGTINPIEKIIKTAHRKGANVLIDGAQAGAHIPIDVQKLDCDFYVLSGHKMYGPTGVGGLYGKKELLNLMPPYQTGGHMIKKVKAQFAPRSPTRSGSQNLDIAWADLPHKFEAGTANISAVIGLGAAIDFLSHFPSPGVGRVAAGQERSKAIRAIQNHESILTSYALKQMKKIPSLEIYGPQDAKDRIGVISFNLKGIPPHDLASILDSRGIAIRTGHHCAMPLHDKLGIESSARISLAIYNTKEDINKLTEGIRYAQRLLSFPRRRESSPRSWSMARLDARSGRA